MRQRRGVAGQRAHDHRDDRARARAPLGVEPHQLGLDLTEPVRPRVLRDDEGVVARRYGRRKAHPVGEPLDEAVLRLEVVGLVGLPELEHPQVAQPRGPVPDREELAAQARAERRVLLRAVLRTEARRRRAGRRRVVQVHVRVDDAEHAQLAEHRPLEALAAHHEVVVQPSALVVREVELERPAREHQRPRGRVQLRRIVRERVLRLRAVPHRHRHVGQVVEPHEPVLDREVRHAPLALRARDGQLVVEREQQHVRLVREVRLEPRQRARVQEVVAVDHHEVPVLRRAPELVEHAVVPSARPAVALGPHDGDRRGHYSAHRREVRRVRAVHDDAHGVVVRGSSGSSGSRDGLVGQRDEVRLARSEDHHEDLVSVALSALDFAGLSGLSALSVLSALSALSARLAFGLAALAATHPFFLLGEGA